MPSKHPYGPRLLYVALGFAALAGTSSIVASPDALQVQRDRQHPAKQNVYRVPSFDALEPKTADEIVQARFFAAGYKKLSELGEGNFISSVEKGPLPAPPPPGARTPPKETKEELLRGRVCSAATVFIGKVSGFEVRLTEGGMWLFTRYKITPVAEVKPDRLGESVSISIQSGVAEVAGKILSTISTPLLADGSYYLFFASRIPQSSAFVPVENPEEVSWPADKSLRLRLEQIAQLAGECRQESRP